MNDREREGWYGSQLFGRTNWSIWEIARIVNKSSIKVYEELWEQILKELVKIAQKEIGSRET